MGAAVNIGLISLVFLTFVVCVQLAIVLDVLMFRPLTSLLVLRPSNRSRMPAIMERWRDMYQLVLPRLGSRVLSTPATTER